MSPSEPDGPLVGGIEPTPTAEEVAAIVAAVDAAWPRPVVAGPPHQEGPSRWRFSGRWWSRPIVQRRQRPW